MGAPRRGWVPYAICIVIAVADCLSTLGWQHLDGTYERTTGPVSGDDLHLPSSRLKALSPSRGTRAGYIFQPVNDSSDRRPGARHDGPLLLSTRLTSTCTAETAKREAGRQRLPDPANAHLDTERSNDTYRSVVPRPSCIPKLERSACCFVPRSARDGLGSRFVSMPLRAPAQGERLPRATAPSTRESVREPDAPCRKDTSFNREGCC
ncbi:hypothetical protein C8Q78DRAFT_606998 [Trametes maxima]|nr:hypothetical protein C8Q78DRAFT_606998 [Trametes maxima]